ncbi:pirin family protein [Couchioplanes caeruleus]|uniref:pirin family protein n=1 Tax=Couchioplanes caeruleus TaxID=56438 RepID=UPI0020C01C75|nr:pirin family protein [Couchioplanes caeruleus]UQU68218.1 pirin family protein [Couchioplanes caeruleus]
MSNLQADPEVGGHVTRVHVAEMLEGAPVALGGPRGMEVVRTLPHKQRRMVGAWCFLDAYGPHDLTAAAGMRVGPHPHIGLQTVSWLVSGEILHRDSLGNRQEIRPGSLNLMTAGRGISHSEETPVTHGPVLQGVQLWVALPAADRDVAPSFTHHDDLPVLTGPGLSATVLMGDLAGATSPARCHTPLVGAEITLAAGSDTRLPLRPGFEYAVLTLDGEAAVAGTPLKPGPLLYLGAGRSSLSLSAGLESRVLLLGGEPFEEKLVMWWNFVGREHDEIVAAREAWESGDGRFGTVRGYDGPSIPAPPMPITRLVPRGRVRSVS